jgi:hypothetical protein
LQQLSVFSQALLKDNRSFLLVPPWEKAAACFDFVGKRWISSKIG